MTSYIEKCLKEKYSLSSKNIGEYSKIDKKGMHFDIRSFDVDGKGSLMIMNMKAMLGLVKMTSAVFTPTDVDMPMGSFDYVSAMGNETLALELYNTCIDPWSDDGMKKAKKSGSNLPDHNPGEHWYDSIKYEASSSKKCKGRHDQLSAYAQSYIEEYVNELQYAKNCDRTQKMEKTAEYTENLIKNGGPAVDQFNKMLGEEKTAEFLRKYMFVCEQ